MAASDDANALSSEERQHREAEVIEALLATERDEAALIWRARGEGLPVEHRGDCSPLAVLGLRLVSKSRRDPPGTGWQHAWDKVMGGRRPLEVTLRAASWQMTTRARGGQSSGGPAPFKHGGAPNLLAARQGGVASRMAPRPHSS